MERLGDNEFRLLRGTAIDSKAVNWIHTNEFENMIKDSNFTLLRH